MLNRLVLDARYWKPNPKPLCVMRWRYDNSIVELVGDGLSLGCGVPNVG